MKPLADKLTDGQKKALLTLCGDDPRVRRWVRGGRSNGGRYNIATGTGDSLVRLGLAEARIASGKFTPTEFRLTQSGAGVAKALRQVV